MTKEEAKEVLGTKPGVKIRHKYFSPDEWVRGTVDDELEFEDGVVVEPFLFWSYRNADHFNDGWELFTP